MTRYSRILFRQSVYDPSRASAGEKRELIIGTNDLALSRDGLVVTIFHAPSGRSVEVPWSGVRYAILMAPPSTPAAKGR